MSWRWWMGLDLAPCETVDELGGNFWSAIEWPEYAGIEWYRKRPPIEGWQ